MPLTDYVPATIRNLFSRGSVPRTARSIALFDYDALHEPGSIPELVERLEKDCQFLLANIVLRSVIQSVKVTIEVVGDSRAQALADNLTKRFEEALPHALKAIGYGRAAFERWYDYDGASGLYMLASMDALPFRATKMRFCEGYFDGIDVKVKGKGISLSPAESWWFALDADLECPHGRSRYLGAPLEIWKARCRVAKNQELWEKKRALGHGVIRAPGAYDPKSPAGRRKKPDGTPADPLEDAALCVEALRSGGIAVLQSDRQDGAYIWDYTPPPDPVNGDPFAPLWQRLDAYALRSMGVPERSVTQDQATGSFGMAEVHWRVLNNVAFGILSQLVASYQETIIDDAVMLNYPAESRPTLTMVAQPLDEARKAMVCEIVKGILLAGQVSPIVTEGVVDVPKLFEIADIPISKDAKAALEQVRAIGRQQAAAAPAIGGPSIPQGMTLQLDNQPKPPGHLPTWEQVADRSMREETELLAELFAAIDDPKNIDRGRL